MTRDQAITWLRAVAVYFDRKATDGKEDAFITAMQQNADNARQIANLIQYERK